MKVLDRHNKPVALAALVVPAIMIMTSCGAASAVPAAQVQLRCTQTGVGVITIVYGSDRRAASLTVSGGTEALIGDAGARGPTLSKSQTQSLQPTMVTEFDAIGAQASPSAAARVAAGYGWNCDTSPVPSK
jgi:hypothetical protein